MKKNIMALILAVQMAAPGWAETAAAVSKSTAAPTAAPVLSEALLASRRKWEPVLKGMGVVPGTGSEEWKFNQTVEKLDSFKAIAERVQQSSQRLLTLAEWVRIMKGMGIAPKVSMQDEEWRALLVQSGVAKFAGEGETSTQVNADPVAETPAAPQAVSSTPALSVPLSSAPAPVAVSAPAALPVAESAPAHSAPPAVPTQVAVNKTPKPAFYSKPISLELRGMDVLEALKIMAKQGGLNIVASPNVRGTVTLMLKDVEVWEALRLMLESNDLAYVLDSDVVRVMTGADYEKAYGRRFDDKTSVEVYALKHVKAAPVSKFLESVKSRVGRIVAYDSTQTLILMDTPEATLKMKSLLAVLDQPQEQRVFAVNYAKAEDILAKLTAVATKELGELSLDKRSNRIFAVDSPEKIREMEKIVQVFDGRHRSVLIEAKIIQVSLNKKFQMGVNWEYVFNKLNGDVIPGGVKGNFTVLPTGSLGVAANLGTLAQNNYTALLQMLETAGKTNLLSAPRITALNNESAKILVGTKEAYVTTTVVNPGGSSASTTAEQVNFVDVGVKLFVTPDIGEDGYISLKIKPEISSVERTISTSQGNTIPILRTSESETSVVARDGETILIAGLIEDRTERTDSRVPFLGRIPLLGIPFRGRTDVRVKNEIVLLLTPKIISGENISDSPAQKQGPAALEPKKG